MLVSDDVHDETLAKCTPVAASTRKGTSQTLAGTRWQFKRFADASSKPWFEAKWKDKVFGGFTNSASLDGNKLNTLTYFVLLSGQHGGLWVSLAMKPANVKASPTRRPEQDGGLSRADGAVRRRRRPRRDVRRRS